MPSRHGPLRYSRSPAPRRHQLLVDKERRACVDRASACLIAGDEARHGGFDEPRFRPLFRKVYAAGDGEAGGAACDSAGFAAVTSAAEAADFRKMRREIPFMSIS